MKQNAVKMRIRTVPISKIARRSKVEKSIGDLVDGTMKDLSGGEVRSEPRLRIGFGRS